MSSVIWQCDSIISTISNSFVDKMKPSNIINMDFNSTTPMESEVISVITETCANLYANPSSSYGGDVMKVIEDSRKEIANMVNSFSDEIIFTSGGTEANNWVIYSSVYDFNKTRDKTKKSLDASLEFRPHIVTTNIEHDSIRIILEKLASDDEIDLSIVPVSKTGYVEAADIINAITPQTTLVTVMLANNETGILQPVPLIAKMLLTVNANRSWPKVLFHTDAAQAIGKLKTDVKDLGVDYLTIVGHKFYAPRIGALYRRRTCPLHPIFFGGGQEGGLRPGTENTPMIAGLGVAARLVYENLLHYERHMESRRREMEIQLAERFQSLITVNGLLSSIYGRLPNTVSLTFNDQKLKGHRILSACSNLRASVGAACHSGSIKPSAILVASGIDPVRASCTIRLSLGRETQTSDVENTIDELENAVGAILKSSAD